MSQTAPAGLETGLETGVPARPSRLRHLPLLLLLTAVAAVNLPSLSSYFHGDDFVSLTDPASQPPLEHILRVFTFADSDFYWRPLGKVYFLALYLIGGLDPVPFHIGSLVVFLATIGLLYLLCLRWGFPRPVALAACCLFGLYPNHVVSVVWITNAPRLLAMMFFLGSLLAMDAAARRGGRRFDALAWVLFLFACLSDETTLALAPLLPLFGLLRSRAPRRWKPFSARLALYGLTTAVLVPLQFLFTIDDEPRLADYALGRQTPDQVWALASQLVLPVQRGQVFAESFTSIRPEQWVAGALLLAIGLFLVVAGSWSMRFLVLWTALALAPFSLWQVSWTAPRYVYMAALPFSIAVAWFGYEAWRLLPRVRWTVPLRYAVVPISLLALGCLGGKATIDRNNDWARTTHPYETLADGLKQAVPRLESHSRLIIYYGVWDGFPLWPEAVVRTVYGDPSIDVVNVRKDRSEGDWPKREKGDVVVYFAQGKFIPVPPSIDSRTATTRP